MSGEETVAQRLRGWSARWLQLQLWGPARRWLVGSQGMDLVRRLCDDRTISRSSVPWPPCPARATHHECVTLPLNVDDPSAHWQTLGGACWTTSPRLGSCWQQKAQSPLGGHTWYKTWKYWRPSRDSCGRSETGPESRWAQSLQNSERETQRESACLSPQHHPRKLLGSQIFASLTALSPDWKDETPFFVFLPGT